MTPGKRIKDNMLRGMRCCKVVKDHAYDLTEDALLQLRTLQILVTETVEFVDSLKQEDTTQDVLALDLITTNGTEENYGATDHGN